MTGTINSNYPSYGGYSLPRERYGGTSLEIAAQSATKKSEYESSVLPKQSLGESRLSAKAQSYLKTLQSQFGDYDIYAADSDDDHKSLLNSGDKEFSVVFSSEELEKMADDPEYAKEQIEKMQRMIDMSKRICEQNGFLSGFEQTVGEKGDILKSLTISTDKDGNLQFFAELEKLSEKQRERIEEKQEKKQAEKKDEDDKAFVKSTTLHASSEDELIKKFKELDWNSIPEKEQETKPVIEYRI
ncbi:MAG: DUF6033 family protein [Lachnospiraceae bacterium]|nr:DUF6033 family protein [Lachnospiraceae bacterium]